MRKTWSVLASILAAGSLAWAGEVAKTTLKIEGMTCAGCVPAVKVQLKNTEGVVSYDVSFEKGEAVVSYDPARTTPARIAASVTTTGYQAFVKPAGAAVTGPRGSAPTAPAVNGDVLERVTLFHVPLMCPAVKGLGCGGKARPFMADLESQPQVAEAWLNHPGTMLAVVWKEPQKRSKAIGVVTSLFRAKDLTVTALEGVQLNDGLQDFATRARWYRGQDVNRLSEQEGRIFTERMAKRVESRMRLSPESSAALRADLQRFCIEWLVGQGGRDTKVLLELGAKYLDPTQLKVYENALKEGFQALPGESLS